MNIEQSPEHPHSQLDTLRLQAVAAWDWEHMLRGAMLDHDHEAFATAVNALAAVSANPPRFRGHDEHKAALETLIATAPADRPPPPGALDIDPGLANTLDTWHTDNQACLPFLNQARRDIIHLYHRVLGDRLELLIMDSGWLENGCPPIVRHALTTIAREYMAGLDNLDSEWLHTDTTTAPNATFVGNYHDLSLLKLGLGRHETATWVQEQLDNFPHWMTAGIPAVTISPHTHTVQRTDGTWRTLGDYAIAAEPPRMDRSINVYANLMAGSSMARQGYLNIEVAAAVIIHEIGHFAHFNRVPLAWLREHWLPAIRQERVSASPYVASKWNEGATDEAMREDFCDSLKFYQHEPAELMGASKARMYALNELIGRYDTRLIDSWADSCREDNPRIRTEIKTLFLLNAARRRAQPEGQQQI